MGLFGKAKPVLVVDTSAVLKTKGVRGRPAPRQQLQILRTLSRLVQREGVKVTAVMSGNPLDKAPHNKLFDGVRVRYAESDEGMNKELQKALRQAGSAGVLVTEDVELEKQVRNAGSETLRISTFRKLLDDGNEQSGGNGGNEGGGKGRQGNNRRRRNNKKNPQKQEPKVSKQEQKEQNEDKISQMIDLID